MNIIEIRYQKKDAIAADILKSFLDFIGYYSELQDESELENQFDEVNPKQKFIQSLEEQIRKYQTEKVESKLAEELLQVLKKHQERIQQTMAQRKKEDAKFSKNIYQLKPIPFTSLKEVESQVLTDFLSYYTEYLQNKFQDSTEVLQYLKTLFIEHDLLKAINLLSCEVKEFKEELQNVFLLFIKKFTIKLKIRILSLKMTYIV